MRNSLAIVLLCAASASAQATLCKYVDESGNITYSDSSVKGAKKDQCFEAPAAPAAARAAPPARQPAAPKRAVAAPQKDDYLAQRRREDRRKILEDELAQEEKLLDESRKEAAAGEGVRMGGERNYQRYLDRVEAQKEAVAKHESNVFQLRQELNNLR